MSFEDSNMTERDNINIENFEDNELDNSQIENEIFNEELE